MDKFGRSNHQPVIVDDDNTSPVGSLSSGWMRPGHDALPKPRRSSQTQNTVCNRWQRLGSRSIFNRQLVGIYPGIHLTYNWLLLREANSQRINVQPPFIF